MTSGPWVSGADLEPWVRTRDHRNGGIRHRPRIMKARGFWWKMYGDVWLLIRWDVGPSGSQQVRITGYNTWREAISAIT